MKKQNSFQKLRLAPKALAVAAGAGLMMAAAPVDAAVISLSTDVTVGGVSYSSIDNFTVSSPLTELPGATGSSAYGIGEASTASGTDAFDGFAGITVDGVAFNQPNDQVDLTSTPNGASVNTITPMDIAGIDTSLDYFMSATNPTLRAIGTFTNTTASEIIAEIAYGGDLGCDSNCQIEDSSTGDTSFQSQRDQWFIVSDGSEGDPTLTFSRFGAGKQFASSTPEFPNFSGELGDIWTLSLDPGETQSLMWFTDFNPTVADAQARASIFTDLSSLGAAGLLVGLSSAEIDRAVNWNQDATPDTASTPEPGTILGMGLSVLFGLFWKQKRNRHRHGLNFNRDNS